MREFGVKPRILVVEDDSDIAMALSDDLSIEGFDVEIAKDGEDARFGGWLARAGTSWSSM